MSHADRKADHIRINLEEDVSFDRLTSGFERYQMVHQALPEVDFSDVKTEVTLFGRTLRAPLLISSMTGGTERAEMINRRLAVAAQEQRVAIGVGSQRAALEMPETAESFRIRTYAPDALILANLGAVQLNYGYGIDHCRRAVDMAEADGLILHLNPLQEVLQEGGDLKWAGLLGQIESVCRQLDCPVIAKEVGWGISREAARHLIEAGISAIDVAGAGGTSWSEVEKYRASSERLQRLAGAFRDWGIPTAASIRMVDKVRQTMGRKDLPIIASGGIRTGMEMAKALALGSSLVGIAGPFLQRVVESTEAVIEEMESLTDEMKIAMFATGSATCDDLCRPGTIISVGELYE